jgi:hypothetical protein
MREVEAIRRRLDGNGDIGEIRNDIAELIADQLGRAGETIGYWEKAHFANAIATLARNIHSTHQPTVSWLRLCLVNVEKALVPADRRDENYTPKDHQLDALTFQQLTEALEMVRGSG